MECLIMANALSAMILGNFDLYQAMGPLQQQQLRFALIRYGGGIVQMSGSIAGNTFARNRFGNYARARTKPVNPRSPRQMGARTAVMMLAEQWRESPMTDVIRTAWQTYANSVDWLNKLGETVTLTGFNMFMRANTLLLRAGKAIVTAAPVDLGRPGGDPTMVISALSAAAQTFTLTFDDGFDWCSEDDAYLIVDAGSPQNRTRNFFNGPWRFNNEIIGSNGVPIVSPIVAKSIVAWTAIEGQKIWFRFSIIRADGRVSTKFADQAIIVAA